MNCQKSVRPEVRRSSFFATDGRAETDNVLNMDELPVSCIMSMVWPSTISNKFKYSYVSVQNFHKNIFRVSHTVTVNRSCSATEKNTRTSRVHRYFAEKDAVKFNGADFCTMISTVHVCLVHMNSSVLLKLVSMFVDNPYWIQSRRGNSTSS